MLNRDKGESSTKYCIVYDFIEGNSGEYFIGNDFYYDQISLDDKLLMLWQVIVTNAFL